MCKQSSNNGRNVPSLYAPAHYPLECQGGVVGPGSVSLLHPNMVPALGPRANTGCSAALTYLRRWPLAINGQRLETDGPGKVSGLRRAGFGQQNRPRGSRLYQWSGDEPPNRPIAQTYVPPLRQRPTSICGSGVVVLRDETRIYFSRGGERQAGSTQARPIAACRRTAEPCMSLFPVVSSATLKHMLNPHLTTEAPKNSLSRDQPSLRDVHLDILNYSFDTTGNLVE